MKIFSYIFGLITMVTGGVSYFTETVTDTPNIINVKFLLAWLFAAGLFILISMLHNMNRERKMELDIEAEKLIHKYYKKRHEVPTDRF